MSRPPALTQTAPTPTLNAQTRVRRYLTRVYPQPGPPEPLREAALTVGRRGGTADVQVVDPRMSRAHFELRRARAADVIELKDLGSKNGTLLNGLPARTGWLTDGAIIRSGDTIFAFAERPEPPMDPPPVPPGKSVALSWAEWLVDQVADSGLPILITGPTGAGKELIARRVHARSARGGDFVPVNCATLPRDLIGSELFGHVRGAFSGASGARDGLFRMAQGGTIFLDEIGELPAEQQPALLRVLQEKRVRPLGADREIPVDVRIVAATLHDPRALAAQGFRPDLQARLAGVHVELPGLDRRRADVLPLLRVFLGDAIDIDVDTAELLLIHDWPDNVRGLQHLAGRVSIFARAAGRITPAMLPHDMQRPAPLEASSRVPDHDRLRALLSEHRGNVAGVARVLGQSRQKTYRQLQAFGIDAESFR